jgi:enolase
MTKVIVINTPTGQYELPLLTVAEDRAEYYSEKDGFDRDSMEWQEEVDFVMDDSYEGIDWLMNNSDWEEWEELATKINDEVKVLEDDFWTSSDDFEITETVS